MPGLDAKVKDRGDDRPVVLVIDDQAANVRLVAALLTRAGYDCVSALGGHEGLALARETPPDLVLLDMRMPEMDGLQVLAQLRMAPETATLPVIFLTADDERENLIRAFAAGVNDYVTKPFVARELLARVRTHVDLKKAHDALRRFAQEKQDMAELVAHDLRNYLANIMFASELQRSTPGADAAIVKLAKSIHASADSGLLFLQALLEQQEDQSNGGLFEPLPVRQLLHEVIDLLDASASAKGIQVSVLPHELLVMSGLRSGVVHVLQNLLSNAIKYSPLDSRIEIGVSRHGQRGRLTVMDRGPGIAEAERHRLFERFARLSSETTGGESSTGLGLALAKQKARAMGGELWFEAREGGGSCFTLDLPLA